MKPRATIDPFLNELTALLKRHDVKHVYPVKSDGSPGNLYVEFRNGIALRFLVDSVSGPHPLAFYHVVSSEHGVLKEPT